MRSSRSCWRWRSRSSASRSSPAPWPRSSAWSGSAGPLPVGGTSRAERWRHLLAETLGHTRMLQWTKIGAAHWFVFIAFGALFFTLVTAYGQLFDPRFALPLIGHWVVYEWASEIIAWAGLIAIGFLIIVRLLLRGPRPGVPVLRLADLAGRLRRADHPRHRRLRDRPPRPGVPAARASETHRGCTSR